MSVPVVVMPFCTGRAATIYFVCGREETSLEETGPILLELLYVLVGFSS